MKKMSDDDVQNFVWQKMIGDLDGIASHGMFDEDEAEKEISPTADPKMGEKSVGHEVHVHIHPNMAADDHGDHMGQQVEQDDLEDLKDRSEIFARLHKK